MLLAERVDALTAMGSNMAFVCNNLPAMLTLGRDRAGADSAQFGDRLPRAGRSRSLGTGHGTPIVRFDNRLLLALRPWRVGASDELLRCR
jgi:hypothetical protein